MAPMLSPPTRQTGQREVPLRHARPGLNGALPGATTVSEDRGRTAIDPLVVPDPGAPSADPRVASKG